jgi:hypothetical protein
MSTIFLQSFFKGWIFKTENFKNLNRLRMIRQGNIMETFETLRYENTN